MVIKEIYKTKGEQRDHMAQKLPGTVIRKREKKDTERQRKVEREGARKGEMKRGNIPKERVKQWFYLFCLIGGKTNRSQSLP